MSKAQAETVIKNIIREIVQECTTRGQVVSETLVAFTVIKHEVFCLSIGLNCLTFVVLKKGKSSCFRSRQSF
jgi:hypothetical protein